ncbi:MAG TPA: hypothetical protein VF322_10545 [Gammaproteobacteria bacterium]
MERDPERELATPEDRERLLALLRRHRRILLTGGPGAGKSTLAKHVAAALERDGVECACLGCDPGSPAFGVPGAVCLGVWRRSEWRLRDLAPLCTLDAGRFRLPLVRAVSTVLRRFSGAMLLVDGPGVERGVAAAELLAALVDAADVDLVLLLERDRTTSLEAELRALPVPAYRMPAAPGARSPGERARARQRTALWDAHLAAATEHSIALDAVPCLGTPPPRDAPAAWAGRQVAFLRGEECVALGEVASVTGSALHARAVGAPERATALLLRDAQRGPDGLLGTAKRAAREPARGLPPELVPPGAHETPEGPRPVVDVGPFVATLVNGVFGDPLLHVRQRHGSRTLLLDLGEALRLRARAAHRVTDVFVSHAHVDHVAGFLWLLRSRIGVAGACRLFGPAGLAANIAGMVAGIHWDRVGGAGPRFDVTELHEAGRAVRFTVAAGEEGARLIGETVVSDGVLLEDPLLRVRAAVLDHRTPVLAFALEPRMQINVRKERLRELGLAPGPWLDALKRHILAGAHEALVRLPDGRERSVAALADELVIVRPGEKLVYATDLADTAENRARLTRLAAGAHTFFCEATFCEEDAAQAARKGHLTARACGEIATAAKVARLVPFHFSRRYASDPAKVYREVRAACARAVVPRLLHSQEPSRVPRRTGGLPT